MLPTHPSIFDTAGRLLRFGVTDAGELVGGHYRETSSNALIGRLVGRHANTTNEKVSFTASDVAYEGYAFKLGSWMKSWKKRYFILRTDIHSLCYYTSQEELRLLGSVQLGIDTHVQVVPPSEVNGLENVILLVTEDEAGTHEMHLRFENFEEMKTWVAELNNATQHLILREDRHVHWWHALFDDVPSEENINSESLATSPVDSLDSNSLDGLSLNPPGPTDFSHPNTAISDDESDEDVSNVVATGSGTGTGGSSRGLGSASHLTIARSSVATGRRASMTTATRRKIHPVKPLDNKKRTAPIPIMNSNNHCSSMGMVYESWQLAVHLENSCTAQDRFFMVVFGSDSEVRSASSQWTEVFRTEVQALDKKSQYTLDELEDVCLMFSLTLGRVPPRLLDLRISLFRQNVGSMTGRRDKSPNLLAHTEVARVVFPRHVIEIKRTVKMVMSPFPNAFSHITISPQGQQKLTLGIAHLTSEHLIKRRCLLENSWGLKPYSEVCYSFPVSNGVSFSHEQLIVSRYSIEVAQALLGMFREERGDWLATTIPELHAELNENSSVTLDDISDKHSSVKSDPTRSIDSMIDAFQGWLEITALAQSMFQEANALMDNPNSLIPGSHGGSHLRRSVWKKASIWQYCSMNLNAHFLHSHILPFADITTSPQSKSTTPSRLHVIPTLTMGCPTAHELRGTSGGLRKLFLDINPVNQKLMWMQALQAPNHDLLDTAISCYPAEAALLFGPPSLRPPGVVGKAFIARRKLELAEQIDVCASQALGAAITYVKTIVHLASTVGGNYLDVLSRSLKIGFFIQFQSLLSSQGAELAMLEDAEIAILWLQLVTLRLVAPGSLQRVRANLSESDTMSSIDQNLSEMGRPVFEGNAPSITCRRDCNGRITLDVEVTAEEEETVVQALRLMDGFSVRSALSPIGPDGSIPSYAFDPAPMIVYRRSTDAPYPIAVCEIVAALITQGVNEMQSLANLAMQREVLVQLDLNQLGFQITEAYFTCYRAALEFQLQAQTEKMISSLGTIFAAAKNSTPAPQSKMRRRTVFLSGEGLTLIGPSSDEAIATGVEQVKRKVLSFNDRMLEQLRTALHTLSANAPHEKHMDVLLLSDTLSRQMSGLVTIMCKSGKDRTGMGVTLDIARCATEHQGVTNGMEVCMLLRSHGVRRMNVFANTGQSMYAFNSIQRRYLPACYRPPSGSFAGNVST